MGGFQPSVAPDAFGPGGLDQARRMVEEAPGQARAFEQALRASEGGGPDSAGATADTSATADMQAAADAPATADVPSAPQGAGDVGLDRVSGSDAAPGAAPDAAPDGKPPVPGAAEQMLRRVASGQKRLSEILGELDSGRSFSAREMLAMQSEMHQITRQLETTTKLMGEVVSGAKTIFQQQI